MRSTTVGVVLLAALAAPLRAAAQTQIMNDQDASQMGMTFTQYPFTYNGGPRWKYDTREYGYSYVSSERPQANVPYSILKGEKFFGYNNQLFCNQTASYNNLSCTNPPEQVGITWMTQSVVDIDTKGVTHALNFYMKVQWRDWRLSYTEGGVTCFNAATPPLPLGGASSYDLTQLQAALYEALWDAWGCDASAPADGCYPYLPRGVLPSVTAVYGDNSNTTLVISVFPAPNFLFAPGGPDGTTVDQRSVPDRLQLYTYMGFGAANGSAAGDIDTPVRQCVTPPCTSQEQYSAFVFDALAATGDAALAAVPRPAAASKAAMLMWQKRLIPCSGVRRTPGYLILVPDRQADQAAPLGNAQYGDYRHPHLPSVVNPNSFWTPFMVDSINQMGAEENIMDQWQLYPNGTVSRLYHFAVNYKAVMPLDAFPFDKHYFIATRRTRAQMVDRVMIEVARAGFSITPKNPSWVIGTPSAMVCPRHEVSGWDATDCRALCTSATCPGWEPGMPAMYVPPAANCPPNPNCNATFPFPNCHATCGETAAMCQDIFVFYYRVHRKPEYFLQNMLAPIILITIMAAAAYWNELDDYADRVGLMATALLSMMALQAYVSGALPETQTVTFIHYALYTSYALMGFGLAFIIAASFCLKRDVAIAKGEAESVKLYMLREYYREAILAAHLLRAVVGGGGSGPPEVGELHYFPEVHALWVSPAEPRLSAGGGGSRKESSAHGGSDAIDAAAAAAADAALADGSGGSSVGHGCPPLIAPRYVAAAPAAPAPAGQPKTLGGRIIGKHLVATTAPPPPPRGASAQRDATGSSVIGIPPPSVGGGEGGSKGDMVGPIVVRWDGEAVPVPYVPTLILLRRFIVELDSFMRYGHLLAFIVVIGARYFSIISMEHPAPSCANLMNFVSSPEE